MKKIAIAVNDFGPSQLSFCTINLLNNLAKDNPSVLGFYETLAIPCIKTNFARSQIFDGYSFEGKIIATSLSTADKILKFPATKDKFFYIWDLEWVRIHKKRYDDLHFIYANKEFKLIARSDEHKKIIEDCWNCNVSYVIDNFDSQEFLKLLYE